QRFGRWRRSFRNVARRIEREPSIFDDLVDRVAWVHARQREVPIGKSEQASVSHQCNWASRSVDIACACAWRTDEIDLGDERTAGGFSAEKNDFRNHIVEIGRPEGAGEAHLRLLVVAGTHEIDVAMAIDLPA